MVLAALLAALFAAVGTEVMLDYETNNPLDDIAIICEMGFIHRRGRG